MGMASLWSDALELKTTVDFEGATIKRGGSSAGIMGKGTSIAAIPTRISTSS